MASKSITKKPSVPSGASIKRNGYKFTASWKKAATAKSNNARVTSLHVLWYLNTRGADGKIASRQVKDMDLNLTRTTAEYNLYGSDLYEQEDAAYKDYCPFAGTEESDYATAGKVLLSVSAKIRFSNSKGSSSKTVEFPFRKPEQPSASIGFDNGMIKGTYSIKAERRFSDTNRQDSVSKIRYEMTRQEMGEAVPSVITHEVEGEEVTLSGAIDVSDLLNDEVNMETLVNASPEVPVRYGIRARALGFGGMSDEAVDEHIMCVPLQPRIKAARRIRAGQYDVEWDYDSGSSGWYPIDEFEIRYCDMGIDALDESDEDYPLSGDNNADMTGKARDGLKGTDLRRAQTDDINGVTPNTARWMSVRATRDNNVTAGINRIADWGVPANAAGISVNTQGDKPVITVDLTGVGVCNCKLPASASESEDERFLEDFLIFRNNAVIGKLQRNNNKELETTFTDESYAGEQCVWGVAAKLNGSLFDEWTLPEARFDVMSRILWSADMSGIAMVDEVIAHRNADCESATVTWTTVAASGADAVSADGVEVAWSEYSDAFWSNQQPTIAEFTDRAIANGANPVVNIRGLTAGKSYTFWVRKFVSDEDGDRTYSPWVQSRAKAVMSAAAENPTIELSRGWVLEDGRLPVSWTYAAADETIEYESSVRLYAASDADFEHPLREYGGMRHGVNSFDLIADGDGAYNPLPVGEYALVLTMTSSNEDDDSQAVSEPVTFGVVRRPSCSISAKVRDSDNEDEGFRDDEETATETVGGVETEYTKYEEGHIRAVKLPISVNVSGTGSTVLRVKADFSTSYDTPTGMEYLHEGDTVMSFGAPNGTVTFSPKLIDGCAYRIEAVSTDPRTGLESDVASFPFTVDWEHQAAEPDDSTVTVDRAALSATLVPIKPEGANDSDVCDIYRVTSDGAMPCVIGARWGESYVDPFTPYGMQEAAYRFATRTPDGDAAYCDIDYELDWKRIEIGWEGGSVELPYNIVTNDARSKQFEVRTHLGGGKSAYCKPGINRSHSISTQLVKRADEESVRELYDLSRHDGPCFVRAPFGIAYAGVADVSIERSYQTDAVSVSLTVTECDDDGSFMAERAQ